jgi:hypothetical protein
MPRDSASIPPTKHQYSVHVVVTLHTLENFETIGSGSIYSHIFGPHPHLLLDFIYRFSYEAVDATRM